jgi:two-component system LytT family response regulator
MMGMPEKISAVVVDDEELARRILCEYLADFPEITVAAECANGFEAVKTVNDLKPQLLFLDIQMPKLSGFEVLEVIDHDPAIIFVTAYDAYALQAFEVHAVDYLLKPFSRDRLAEALDRARQRLNRRETSASIPKLIAESRKRALPLERILVRDGSRVHVVATRKIDYLEAQDDYVCIKSEGKEYLKQESLSSLEENLDPGQFVRIHRSYILNLERLQRLELLTKDSRVAILSNGIRLPVSKAGYARLKPLL